MNHRLPLPLHPASDRSVFLDILTAGCSPDDPVGADRQISESTDPQQPWIYVTHAGGHAPAQGWKLHVSATVATAEEVLRRALSVLRPGRVGFKIASSPHVLARLNLGELGPTQVGKFITVYPRDDEQAVGLAVALDRATRGLDGPTVASDRALRPGSLVSYRYGGFRMRRIQTPLGEIVPAIEAADGALVPDRRLPYFLPPAWATDPFDAAGVVERPERPDLLVGGRYLRVATLAKSPRSSVYFAMDTEMPRHVILKRGRRGAAATGDGRDARDRLRHEADVLAALAPNPHLPSVVDMVEAGDDLYLVMEEIVGETLEQHVTDLRLQGRFTPQRQLIAWGRELASLVGAIHARGLVYRDLKSTNLIVAPDEGTGGGAPVVGGWGRDNAPNSKKRLRLLDFELACRPSQEAWTGSIGTSGYMSPQQAERRVPAVTDDVYGVGALLYFMATGAEPSQAPDPLNLLRRPLSMLNPGIGDGLVRVIGRCLEPVPSRRYLSMAALERALAEIAEEEPPAPAPFGVEPAITADPERCAAFARRLGDSICAAVRPAPGEAGRAWATAHPMGGGLCSRDVNTGNAGTLLALVELVAAFGDPGHRSVLAESARWLVQAPPLEGRRLPGLYVGEAGIGAALLRAGQVLHDPALLAAAAERGRLVRSLPHVSPDLFNGTAGRLRFHLLLWDETGDAEHLRTAIEAGEALLASAEVAREGGLCWRIPPGYEGLSDTAPLGYAHGAAGIADALLDLATATGDERYLATARGAARWLAGQSMAVLEDRSGIGWPSVAGGDPAPPWWCHGAAGIGSFFLHAAEVDLLPGAKELAVGAARAVARGGRWLGPVQCHGLAGGIEFLLDAYQSLGEPSFLNEAQTLALLLGAFAIEDEGLLLWPSEWRSVVTPDYMVGYAGVALCLLRLGEPERRPRQLSRAGFRWSVTGN